MQRSPHTRGASSRPHQHSAGDPDGDQSPAGGDPIKQFGGGTPQTVPETPHGDPKYTVGILHVLLETLNIPWGPQMSVGDTKRPHGDAFPPLLGTLNTLLGMLNVPWGP